MSEAISLPIYYIIEPTNMCNYQCTICPNRFFSPHEKGYMELGVFTNIITQIKENARVIQLYWMGEALLHPHLIEMIKLCKAETNAKVMLSTNGSLLTHSLTDSLISSGVDEIIISLDAANDQSTYDKIRVGGNLTTVNANVEYLLSANNGKISIVLQFIDMFINRDEREVFKQKWAQFDCATSIQCLYTWSNQMHSLNLASDNLSPVAKKERVPCADLWNKLSIHWDGNVSVCCFDWHTSIPLGNVSEESLMDIWNGKAVRALRESHCAGHYDSIPLCKECDAWAEPDEYVGLYHIEKD